MTFMTFRLMGAQNYWGGTLVAPQAPSRPNYARISTTSMLLSMHGKMIMARVTPYMHTVMIGVSST